MPSESDDSHHLQDQNEGSTKGTLSSKEEG